MDCFYGIELKREEDEELELFPHCNMEDLKLHNLTNDSESKSALHLGELSSSFDFSDILATNISLSDIQSFGDLIQTSNTESFHTEPLAVEIQNEYDKHVLAVGSGVLTDESGYSADEDDTLSPLCLRYTDEELLAMSAKEVNRLKGLTKDEVAILKKRRRVLLNRCYARKSREKRIGAQTSANQEKENLKRGMNELKEELEEIRRDRDMYKEKYNALKEIIDRAVCERVGKNIRTL